MNSRMLNFRKNSKYKKARNSNIELLRILAMFMIVLYHITCHCITVQFTNPGAMGREAVDIFNYPVFYSRLLIINSLMTFGGIGNAVFILISGYFVANRDGADVNIKNISIKLLSQLGFASIMLVCIPPVLHYLAPDIYINMFDATIFNSTSWFVGYYFLIVLCGALFLNKFLNGLEYKKYLTFLLTTFAITQFSWSANLVNNLANELTTLLLGIFLYSLGGFLRKFDPLKNVRVYIFFLLIFIMYVLVWISGYNATETSIENYYRSENADAFIQSIPYFDNSNIIIIIIAISLFEIISRIAIPENSVINFLGKSTFMIYLIHDNNLFYEIWNLCDWVTTLAQSLTTFIMNILKWGAGTFAVGILIYALYNLTICILKKGKRMMIKV